MVKERKRSWKIIGTVVLSILMLVVINWILKYNFVSIEEENFSKNIFLPFVIIFFPISIFLTWKSPKWFIFLDKKVDVLRKKMDSLMYKKEKDSDG